jgi:predicted nicotinamide N-methyase
VIDESTRRTSEPQRRLRELEAWLTSQVELVQQEVILPGSGNRYTVHLPSEASRDDLFAQARADPDKQMPHWAKVWASGVALADVIAERPDDVAGRRVLELGCGLGVTAMAAVAAGASLVVADYSDLPLACCRYNVLQNTGQSPRSLRFNWRNPDRESMTRAGSGSGFPLIMAADVLYESRDIRPLLSLVDQLLAPGGMFWLAEPGRRTAQRFLNTAAEFGWEGSGRQLPGPWPDGTTTPVNVFFLRRATLVDPLLVTLGGWRS